LQCRARYDALKKRKGKSKAVDLDEGSEEAPRSKPHRPGRKVKEPAETSAVDAEPAAARPRPKPRKKPTGRGKAKELETELQEEDINHPNSSAPSKSRSKSLASKANAAGNFGDQEIRNDQCDDSRGDPLTGPVRPHSRKRASSKTRQPPVGDPESEEDPESKKRKSHIEENDAEEDLAGLNAAPRKRGRPSTKKESKPRAVPTRRQPSRASRK
jgi:hypothetical protein